MHGSTRPRLVGSSVSPRPAVLGGSIDSAAVAAACAIAACAASWIFYLHQGILGPLWLDESWTGALASEPTLSGLTEQARNEANAPLYYVLIWFWARVFGVSNLSLHGPSLLLSMATPALAWAGLRHSRPIVACVWAALLALWVPGIAQAGDARCYALLLFLSTAAAVAAMKAFASPTRGRAVLWAVLACLMTLTHYFAGLLALAQGLALMVRYRGRFREAWPAVLVFLPAFAWIAWHAPRLAAFAGPGVAWHEPLTLGDLPSAASFVLGQPSNEAALAAALAVSLMLRLRSRQDTERSWVAEDPLPLVIGALSIAIAILCIGLGMLRPILVLRYLTPFVPGILIVVASGVVAASRANWQPLAILILGSLASVSATVASEDVALDKAFSFEAASLWLAETSPSHLAFLWDNPVTQAVVPYQLGAVGGFFLRRAGDPVDVTPIFPIPGADMNDPVLAAAGPEGAVLWLYDTAIHDTTAILHPPRLDGTNGLQCRNFGIYNVGILACRRSR